MEDENHFAGLARLQTAMTPPLFQAGWPGYMRGWLACLGVALLPLLVPLLVALLSGPAPGQPIEAAEPPTPAALSAAEEASGTLLASPSPPLATRPAELAEDIAALRALAADAEPAPAAAADDAADSDAAEPPARPPHAVYQARVRALLAIFATIALALAMAAAQRQIIDRHTEDFWPAGDLGLPVLRDGKLEGYRPVYLGWAILGTGSIAGAPLLGHAGLVPPWLAPPAPLLGQPGLWAILLAFALSCVALAVVMTALGARIFAGNYPAIGDVEEIGKAIRRGATLRRAKLAAREANILFDARAVPVEDTRFDATELAKDALYLAEQDPAPRPPVPVNRSLAPAHLKAALDALMVALLPVVVAGLVAGALWLDLAEITGSGGAPVAEALAGSSDVLMIAAGLGASAMLALIYLPAATRLAPYISAAADAAAKPAAAAPAEWRFGAAPSEAADGKGRSAEIVMWEPAPEPGPGEWDKEIRLRLGCTRSKFIAIMQAAHYGGGLHEMLEKLGSARLKEAAGLLAPTATGLLLALIG
ncbi:hypothetical protein [Pseudoroseicyclus sp. CXY001]|uniref:hypothetical protein n=1 Tax=Pseudoroseicyclus sp. CXY001 TaxID=3242492 RepID=UPI003570FC23